MNITKLLAKYHSWEKMTKKEETALWTKLRDKADKVFKAWIRKRDEGKNCVSYWAMNCKNKIQNACHRIWCERYSHRRDEKNVVWWCASCNGFNKSEHEKFFMIYQIKKHWQERVDLSLKNRNKIKPRIQDLIDIINKYSLVNTNKNNII